MSDKFSISVLGMYRIMLRPDRTIMPLEYMDLGSFPAFFQPYIKNSREKYNKGK